ncbi:MAG: hypothetical protein K8T91_01290 [Planctomycetes bacterium]|nr:hypothetical protein [Planctomycetota bacterium]
MRIKFTCPAGHRLKARPDKAGTKTVCPACGAEVLVPQAEVSPDVVPQGEVPLPAAPAVAAGKEDDIPLAAEPGPRPLVKRPPLAPSSTLPKQTAEAPPISRSERVAATPPPLRKPPPVEAAAIKTSPSKAPPLPGGSVRSSAAAPPPLPAEQQTPSTTVPPPPLPPAPKPLPKEAAPPALETAKPTPPPVTPMPPSPPPVAATTEPKRADPTLAPQPPKMQEARPAAISPPVDEAKPAPSPPPPVRGYRPDRYKLASVYWLGLALLIITLIEIIPAAAHAIVPGAPYLTLSGAPAWAQAVLVLCLLQLVYIVWMVSLPDWSTVWILMLIYGAVAAAYGFVFAVSLMTPREEEMMLGLDAVRRLTPLWCAAMVLLTFLAAFLCGRTSSRWHRAYVAMVRAFGS